MDPTDPTVVYAATGAGPLPLDRRRPVVHQRATCPPGALPRQHVPQGQLLLRQRRDRRRGAGARSLRPPGRHGVRRGRLARRAAEELQRRSRGAGERPLPLGDRGARDLHRRGRQQQRVRSSEPDRPGGARRGDRARIRTTATSTRWSRTPSCSTRARSRASTCPTRAPRPQSDRHADLSQRDLRLQRLRQDLEADGRRQPDALARRAARCWPSSPRSASGLGSSPGTTSGSSPTRPSS